MKHYPKPTVFVSIFVAVIVMALAGSSCNKGGEQATNQDSTKTVNPESFHSYFSHHGYLDEVKAFFSPETMKSLKVKTAKFFDHFAGKPDFAKDLPDEIKHLDEQGRVVKEEFLSIDGDTYSYGSESWTYDEQGRVLESKIVYPKSTKTTTVAYAYDEGGRVASITTTVHEGDSVHSHLVHEIGYTTKGNIPSHIVHRKNNAETGRVAVQWNKDTLVYQYQGEEDMIVRFSCDAEGKVKEMVEIDKVPADLHKKHAYGYNSSMRVTSKDEHAMLDGKYVLVNTTTWSYDDKGLLTAEEVYSIKDHEKTLVDKSVVEYAYYE